MTRISATKNRVIENFGRLQNHRGALVKPCNRGHILVYYKIYHEDGMFWSKNAHVLYYKFRRSTPEVPDATKMVDDPFHGYGYPIHKKSKERAVKRYVME